MQTTLEIDDTLLHKAMQEETESTESAVVDAALRLYVQMRSQASLRELRGKDQVRQPEGLPIQFTIEPIGLSRRARIVVVDPDTRIHNDHLCRQSIKRLRRISARSPSH